MNPQLEQFSHTLMWMIVPVVILSGLANALGKRRKGRSKSSTESSHRKSGWADVLVMAPWWVSFGLAVVVFVILPGLLPSPFQILSIPIGILLLCLSGISILRSWKTSRMLDGQTSLDSIRELSSKRFEDLLGEAYRRQGYKVEETLGGGADGGVDLILRRDGNITLVQCKRWKGKPVPVQTVRELYGIMHDRGASSAKVVATTTFTPDAVAFATGKPIELVDSNGLLRLLRTVQTSGKLVVPASAEPRHLAPACPRCGSGMKLREAKRGANSGQKFWGCPNYPACGGTRAL